MIEDTPDPAKIMRLAKQALTSAEFRKKFHLADFFGPEEFYEPQLNFFAAGKTHSSEQHITNPSAEPAHRRAARDAWARLLAHI